MFGALIHDDEKEYLFLGISAKIKGLYTLYGSDSVMREDANPNTLNHHLPDSPEGMVMGKTNPRKNPELCKKLSVESNIIEETELPPTLIIHGTKDRVVNVTGSVDLYKQMKRYKKNVRMYFVKSGDHGGAKYWTPNVLDVVDTFIQACVQ